ncbi:hypothetical protein E2C01_015522 [Portunus trituberculatus]|uniref:Uncharacterized protein n=1 Tax=Portunus trituberculatus TaxID=210409 RepID=A0A5B7DMT6_PORTR|nr:hypothetical protein [Portunus trituberculatus]
MGAVAPPSHRLERHSCTPRAESSQIHHTYKQRCLHCVTPPGPAAAAATRRGGASLSPRSLHHLAALPATPHRLCRWPPLHQYL